MKYLYNPPLIIKRMFSDFYWNTSNKKILITFDDGPNPETTELILKELGSNKLKGLFFCVGDNIRKFPELVQMIIDNGHTIGNHTFNHKILRTLSLNEKYEQIEKVNLIVKDKFGINLKYFRPAHGKFELTTPALLEKLNLKNVMWSLLTYDYKNDLTLTKSAIKKYLRNNSIVVLHDSNKSANIISDSINVLVEQSVKKGFIFGDAAECLN